MTIATIKEQQKDAFNHAVTHPLQAYEWGEFRKKTGIKVVRKGLFENNNLTSGFQVTIHKIPHTPFSAGYFPKGNMPTERLISELAEIGKQERCIFIQLEPNVINNQDIIENNPGISQFESVIRNSKFEIRPSVHPLFTKFTFQLDLTKNEDELLLAMHPKTRYNIKVAQKNGVTVEENDSNEAFETYIRLTKETITRQGFFAHSEHYHRIMWETLRAKTMNDEQLTNNQLTAHLLTATYQPKTNNQKPITLVTWILFVFKDTLYYPYGASSREYREVMASNLMMWEAIRFGKKLGLKKFDMWGSLGLQPDPKDPWYGFHRFKQGYGPDHIEFVGSYDLVTNPFIYPVYAIADKVRWFLLNLRK